MLVKRLMFTTRLPISMEEAWHFFSNPRNLKLLTPDWLQLEIQNPEWLPQEIYAGLLIAYKVQALPFFKSSWLTEITQMQPGSYFIDEQRFGPYAFWNHQHQFKSDGADGTIMIDTLHYRLPGSYLGHLLLGTVIKNKIQSIFKYRLQQLEKLFPGTLTL